MVTGNYFFLNPIYKFGFNVDWNTKVDDYFAGGSHTKNHSRNSHHCTGSESRCNLCPKQCIHTEKMATGSADHVSIIMTLVHITLHFPDLCTGKMGHFSAAL